MSSWKAGLLTFFIVMWPIFRQYLVHNRHSTDNCQISEWLNGEDSGPLDPSYLVSWLRVTSVSNFQQVPCFRPKSVFSTEADWSRIWVVACQGCGPSPPSSFYLIPIYFSWDTDLSGLCHDITLTIILLECAYLQLNVRFFNHGRLHSGTILFGKVIHLFSVDSLFIS